MVLSIRQMDSQNPQDVCLAGFELFLLTDLGLNQVLREFVRRDRVDRLRLALLQKV
jgi:hypothetical protein